MQFKARAFAVLRPVHQRLSFSTSAPSLAARMAEQQKAFLSAQKYAVIGASKDETKWGSKVRKYRDDNLESLLKLCT